ncbi:MAG: alpha/beta hydrolase [Bacteroidetes bacterium]|nr:alpha/beta hydrolase [Bacteroidota bacterium]MBS1607689.1 alpha/beta hydrolase [Bacteroidota bacterium]
MRIAKIIGVILLTLILIYWMGPKPKHPQYSKELPVIPDQAQQLEDYIKARESQHKLKMDNEARIVWYNDSLKEKTEYSVVYLHGFSASNKEGDPVHINFAKKFGCNLYLSRLAEHGIDTTEPLLNFTADKEWNSAKEAYEIGRKLGKKVILLSTSTGGTVALKLAADYPDIAGLILLSPNIEINDPNAWVLNNPWGLQVAHLVKGTYNTSSDTSAIYTQYWYNKYRMEAAVELEELLETTMKQSTFQKVKQPTLLLYYYKDEQHQDQVVKVSAMQKMFHELGTDPDQKMEIAIPNAGDHVIGSSIKSKDYKSVEEACNKFAEDILKMKPVN